MSWRARRLPAADENCKVGGRGCARRPTRASQSVNAHLPFYKMLKSLENKRTARLRINEQRHTHYAHTLSVLTRLEVSTSQWFSFYGFRAITKRIFASRHNSIICRRAESVSINAEYYFKNMRCVECFTFAESPHCQSPDNNNNNCSQHLSLSLSIWIIRSHFGHVIYRVMRTFRCNKIMIFCNFHCLCNKSRDEAICTTSEMYVLTMDLALKTKSASN